MIGEGAGTAIDIKALLGLRHVVHNLQGARVHRTAALPGPIVTKRRGRGMEVDEVRAWTHGDDVRHIDRNTTARTGRPHVRTFRDEREQTTLLLADFRGSMLFGTRRAFRSVVAAEILTLAGWRAAAIGGRVSLLAIGGSEPLLLKPAAGDRAMTRIIGGLHRTHAEAIAAPFMAEAPLAAALEMATRALPRGGTIVLASGLDGAGIGFEDAIRAATHRVDLRIALVSDAFERAAPRGAYPFITPEGKRGVHIATHPRAEAGEARIAALRRLGAHVVRFDAELMPERQMAMLGRLHGDDA